MDAVGAGRASAVAGQSQRRMRSWAARYPELYDKPEYDAALFSTLALATAFSGPWFDADQLDMANKSCVWCFGLDWSIDHQATSEDEVNGLLERLRAVADGADPREPELERFLAEIRDELAPWPSRLWRAELDRMLNAMAREWLWNSTSKPSFAEYLDNADNLGFSFVFACHWAVNGGLPADEEAVQVAAEAVQRVVRLLNDLGTYERDVKWGDLNALMLDLDRPAIEEQITALSAAAVSLTAGLPPEHGDYLRRQMEFCVGFYGIADFWGPSS